MRIIVRNPALPAIRGIRIIGERFLIAINIDDKFPDFMCKNRNKCGGCRNARKNALFYFLIGDFPLNREPEKSDLIILIQTHFFLLRKHTVFDAEAQCLALDYRLFA